MDDKKKKFVVPEAEIVSFQEEDIITASDAEDTLNWYTGGGDNDDFLI